MATFTQLPDNTFLQIFSYLPFEERVRIGRVSRCFRRMSLIAISKTKSLDLTENIFRNLTADLFVILLNLCRERLEKVLFDQTDDQTQVGRPHLVVAFRQFAFPRLIEVALGEIDQIDNDLFGSLIRNNDNLKTLICKSINLSSFTYPDFVSQKLETLKLGTCNDQFLNSLTGKCPNLKHFEIGCGRFVNRQLFDNFFDSCLTLQTLICFDTQFEFSLDSLRLFWNLIYLRNLVLYCKTARLRNGRYQLLSDENALTKVVASFPNLEILHINGMKLTSRDVGSLAGLKNLQNLALLDYDCYHNGVSLDAGIRQLANCQQLRRAQFNVRLTPKTIRILVTFCPDLNFLLVSHVERVDEDEENEDEDEDGNAYYQDEDEVYKREIKVAQSLVGVGKTDFTLRLGTSYHNHVIWKSNDIQPEVKLETGRCVLYHCDN